MIYIKQIQEWLQIPKNKNKVIIAVVSIITILIFIYGIYKIIDWWHDVQYQNTLNENKKTAANHETNANQHIANANMSAVNLKELEENEKIIIQKQTDQQKTLANSAQSSKHTRDKLHQALNTSVPNRAGNDGTNDNQLRTDANRAAAAINAARSKAVITPQP